EAVAFRAKLPRHAPNPHGAVLHKARLDRRANPVPTRRVAGIGVRLDPFHHDLRAEIAVAAKEPETVLHDRTAERRAPVVAGDDAGRFLEVRIERANLVGQVLAARPIPGIAVERIPGEDVAARARDDVHERPAAVALAEPAADGDSAFLGVPRVIDI